MGGRDGDEDALFSDGDGAETVDDGDSLEGVLGEDLLRDGHHGAKGQLPVGGVLELLDWFSGEVVSGGA